MDSILFKGWVCEVDRYFTKEGRKFVLLVDKCPAHPSIDNLVPTELIFLPPNTTSKLQPMDQGIIRSLIIPEFSILDDMQMLDVAWGKVSTKTVVNCFEKAEILNEKQFEALLDADDHFKHLQEQLDMLAVYNPNSFPERTTANDIVSVDDSLTSTEPLMTDDVSYATFLDEEGSENEDDTDYVSNEPICLQSSEMCQALDVLQEYMLFSDNGEFIHKSLNEISVLVENKLSAKLRQADIRSFFQQKSRK